MASSGSISSLSTSLSDKILTVEIEASVSGDLGTWTSRQNVPFSAQKPLGVSDGTKLFAGGGFNNGSSFYVYDPSSNSWTSRQSFPVIRYDPTGIYYDGNIYMFGGEYSVGTYVKTTYAYNIANNSWASKADMTYNRGWAASAVYNGYAYVITGYNGTQVDYNEQYNISSNSWSTKLAYPVKVHDPGATEYNSNIYIAGGNNSSGSTVKTVYRYNISSNTYTSRADMPYAKRGIAIGTIGKYLYVSKGGGYKHLHKYDEETNQWSSLNDGNYVQDFSAYGVINNKLYIATGLSGASYVSSHECVTPEGYITLTISSISKTVTLSQCSTVTLDLSSLSSGSYTLTVKLYDSAGTLLDTKTTNVLIASGLLAINSSSAISPFTQVSAQAIYKVNSLSLPNMIALTQAVGNTTFSVSVVSVPIEELITRGQILLSSSSIAQAVEGVMVIGGILLSSSSIAQAVEGVMVIGGILLSSSSIAQVVEGVMVIGGILLSSSSIAQVVDNITTTSDTSFSSLSFYDSTCPIIARGLFILSSINGVGYFTETRATALSDFTSLSREQYIVQTSASGEIMHLSVSNINGLSYMFGLGMFSSSSMLQENLVVCLYSSEETLPILVTSSNVSQVIDNTAASGDVSFNSSVFSNCASLFASQGDFVFVSQGLISQVSEIQSIGLIENLSSPICQYVVQTLSSGQSLFNSQSAVNEFAPIYSMSKIALSTLLNENILANIHSASTISFSGIMSPNLFTCASFSGSFTTEATSIQELIYPTYSEGYTMFISNATINRTTEAKSAGIMTLHNTLLEQYVYGCRSIGIVLFIVSQKVVFCANALSNGHFTFTTLANPVIGKSLLVQDKVFLRTQSDTIGVHIKDDIVSVRLIPDDIAPKEVSK